MEALIAVAAVALFVWAVNLVMRGSLVAGGTVFLFVAYFIGREVLRFEVGPIPMTLERPVLAFLMGVCCLQLLFGVTRWPRMGLAEWSAALLAMLLTFSTFRHDWGWEKYAPVYRLVACFLMPIGLYFVVRCARMSEKVSSRFQLVMLLFGIYLSVTGIAEVLHQWWMVFPSYIADPKLGIHFGRARGASLQSQSLGLFIGLCGVCGWVWLGRLRTFGTPLRIAMVLLFGTTMFLTATRCVWLGGALACFAVLYLHVSRFWRLALFSSAVLAGSLLLYLKGSDLMEIARGDQSRAAAADSVSHRKVYLYVSWLMFCDRPWFGCGAGQFIPESPPYLADHSLDINLDKIRKIPHHNTFLSLLVENGIVGCGLFVAMLWGWGRMAWRLWHSSLPDWMRQQGLIMLASIGVYLPDALFFDPGSYAHQDHYFVFLLAAITSATASTAAWMSPTIPVVAILPTNAMANSSGTSAADSVGLSPA